MNEVCFYSSFIFLSNVIHNYFKNDILYACAFLFLFITSITIHSQPYSEQLNVIDKIAIILVILFGTYRYSEKIRAASSIKNVWLFVPLFMFWVTVIMYTFGYFTDQFCFYPDGDIASQYHACLHVIGSIGHHGIIML